jgi:hypothetical protein
MTNLAADPVDVKKEQKPTVGHSLTLPTTTVTDDAAVRPNIKHQQAQSV